MTCEETVNENVLSDEEYVIFRTKAAHRVSADYAKSWMILAKTLFPRNFDVQFEAYAAHKVANNPKDAARYFSSLFYDFPHEPGLWKEVHEITEGLQSTINSKVSQFYCDLFSNMLLEVQHQILLSMAERTDDVINHCRVLLVLFSKFPHSLAVHGRKLMDRLLAAEKSLTCGLHVNSYRKALITDLLPVFIAAKMADLSHLEQQQLLLLSIEYYSSVALHHETKEFEGSHHNPSQAWNNLFFVIQALGQTLGWKLCTAFSYDANREQLFQSVLNLYESAVLSSEDSAEYLQLVYCTVVLLLESLSVYKKSVYIQPCGNAPNQEKGVLISVCPIPVSSSENLVLESRCSTDHMASIGAAKGPSYPSPTKFAQCFQIAVKCWELLHRTEKLLRSSKKILTSLHSEQWDWLPLFIIDSLIYQRRYNEACGKLSAVMIDHSKCAGLLLKLAGILFNLHDHHNAADQAIRCIEMLVETKEACEPRVSSVPLPKILIDVNFMYYSFFELLSYSIKILVGCLRKCIQRADRTDLALGHLLVLLQYDWPNNSAVLEEITGKIRRHGQLTYPLFEVYIIHVPILEEFALMAAEQSGGVSLDIFPSSVSAYSTTHRMTTRRGDQGAKEDFRVAIKRQIGRNSMQTIEDLVVNFICKERSSILMACDKIVGP